MLVQLFWGEFGSEPAYPFSHISVSAVSAPASNGKQQNKPHRKGNSAGCFNSGVAMLGHFARAYQMFSGLGPHCGTSPKVLFEPPWVLDIYMHVLLDWLQQTQHKQHVDTAGPPLQKNKGKDPAMKVECRLRSSNPAISSWLKRAFAVRGS